MNHLFKIGNHVKWNSEAGYVSGKIIKIHTADFGYKGYTHHASKEDPQYAKIVIKRIMLMFIKERRLQNGRIICSI